MGFIVTGHALLHQEENRKVLKNGPFLLKPLFRIFAAGMFGHQHKTSRQCGGEGSSAALMIREYLKEI